MVARIGDDWQRIVGNGRDGSGEVRLGSFKKYDYQINNIKNEDRTVEVGQGLAMKGYVRNG